MKGAAARAGLDFNRLVDFAAGLHGLVRDEVRLDVQALRSGQRAVAVARITASSTGRRQFRARFIVKCVTGDERREADIYRSLGAHEGGWLAPRLHGVQQLDQEHSHLYLENIVAWRRWPWGDVAVAGQVLDALAGVHTNLPPQPPLVDSKYEMELISSAAATLQLFEQAVREPHLAQFAKAGRTLRRVTGRLQEIRRRLLSNKTAVLHGDVHPGNVMVCLRRRRAEVVLIDWGSVRVGSPLEDVASWLQSLAYWEPEARRRHDTLLRRYLVARGTAPQQLTSELRDQYWLAAACNALAGALRYHLWVARTSTRARQRQAVVAAPRGWLRVIRRADQIWSPGSWRTGAGTSLS